jgi:ribose/xylose/arabinose/galactoside ABC-type transport system permease subunit
MLAGLCGVVFTTYTRFVTPQDTGLLPLALAAVLLGGVSVFGRRGGVLGVLLGVVLVQLVRQWEILSGVEYAWVLITMGVFVLVGIGVNRLLEMFGRMLERPGAPRPGAPPVVAPAGWALNAPQPGWSVPPTSGVPAAEQPER